MSIGRRHQAVLEIAETVGSTLDLDEVLIRVMRLVSPLLDCDRSTLFVVDPSTRELWSRVAQGTPRFKLPEGSGIAGWVASNAEPVMLENAYDDPRFSPANDQATGYVTRSMLVVPFRNPAGEVVGVMQCINQSTGVFTTEDRDILQSAGAVVAVAMENARLYERLLSRNDELGEAEQAIRRANRELEVLVEMERAINQANDLEGLARVALAKLRSIFEGEVVAALLLDGGSVRMWVVTENAFGEQSVNGSLEAVLENTAEPSTEARPVWMGGSHTSVASVPIGSAARRMGALQLAKGSRDRTGDDGGIRILQLVAGRLAVAMRSYRRRAEREREDRLSMVGQFMSGILHDLRTPIAAVKGYVELMADEDDVSERAYYVDQVGRALNHMESLTTEVLAYARGEGGLMIETVDLPSFSAEVAELLQADLGRQEVSLEVAAPTEGIARFDAGKLKRVLFNLARNAAQAGAKEVRWELGLEPHGVWLSVTDDGPGIPEAMIGRLFQPFATHGKQGGTGLGLAMAKRIVEAHGGTIECMSSIGEGAWFMIRLPLDPVQGTPIL